MRMNYKTNRSDLPLPIPDGDIWIFAYGSLIWSPNFHFVERKTARIDGYHRAMCIESTTYRGTPERPGLVLGLDHGGCCEGVAFKICEECLQETMEYLYQREMDDNVYIPSIHPIHFADNTQVSALTFIANRAHPLYVGDLGLEKTADIVSKSAGGRGQNIDYVLNTFEHLQQLKIDDKRLEALCNALV